ncbi:10261_t:CDS:2, partial [Racocetra fulgida]
VAINEEDAASTASSISDPYPNLLFRCNRCTLTAHEHCLPPLNEDDPPELKIEIYREKWNCHLCDRWKWEIDKILTFRYISNKSEEQSSVSNDLIKESEIEALVKFKDRSYLPLNEEDVIPREWLKIHRVLDVEYSNNKTLRDKLSSRKGGAGVETMKRAFIKWKGLKYIESTWEDISELDEKKFAKALKIRRKAYKIDVMDRFVDRSFQEIKKQPAWLSSNPKYKNKLMDYQLDEFHGDKESCEVVEKYEMFPDESSLKCHVLITTPETVLFRSRVLSKVRMWEVMVVDEAHSLKGGDAGKELAEQYQGLPSVEQLPALHKLLKNYFLRRTKSQVNIELPPMVTKARKCKSTGFSNIMMGLRQIVCHPYIINREVDNGEDHENYETYDAERRKKLVESSGKLIILRDMLRKLHNTGHRVLIFSQFVDMLSILEEFCEDEGYSHVKLVIRQENISAFQAPDKDIFIFLLTTRAGGVGLNLMAADTVFIFDPDFNPHQDIQALSRVHRIGQYKPVKVFRFITQFSVEERIVEKGKIKLAKNELVVEKMDDEILDVEEVDDIIRCGVQALFSEDANEKPVGIYTDEAIEKLLDRSQMKAVEKNTESKNLTGFAFARVWDTENQVIIDEIKTAERDGEAKTSTDFWDKILAHVAKPSTVAPIEESSSSESSSDELDEDVVVINMIEDVKLKSAKNARKEKSKIQNQVDIMENGQQTTMQNQVNVMENVQQTKIQNQVNIIENRKPTKIQNPITILQNEQRIKPISEIQNPITILQNEQRIKPISEANNTHVRQPLTYVSGEMANSSQKQLAPVSSAQHNSRYIAPAYNQKNSESPMALNIQQQQQYYAQLRMQQYYRQMQMRRQGYSGYPVEPQTANSLMTNSSVNSSRPVAAQSVQPHLIAVDNSNSPQNAYDMTTTYLQFPQGTSLNSQEFYYSNNSHINQTYIKDTNMMNYNTTPTINNINATNININVNIQQNNVVIPSQANVRKLTNASGDLQQIGLQETTDVALESGSNAPNSNKTMINHFMMIFDKLQKSQEDVTNRLIALIRVYRELQKLEFD